MSVKFSNNATTELASSIGTSDTSITVVDGSKFPILTAGDYTYVTLDTDTASPTREIVRVTAISGNVLTVIRGQDGTSPASFAAGTKVELRLTAALLNDVAGANPSGEPIGFPDKSQTTITFDSGIRTFSITPTGASFDVYCKGVKYTYTTVQLVTIPNTTGLHFIYFNASGVLSTQMSYFTWEEHAPTAYVYWNATTQQAIYFGDERHGITLDWQTHEYLHRTRGAAIANGFAASGYTTTGLGATDADAQIDIAGGTFFDEDMQVDIVSTNSPVAGTWQQDLSGPARIPVMYLSGAAWVIDSPTNFPFKVVSSVPQYNLLSGSTWSTASVTNNSYFVSWILATNNLTYPVISIISQAPTNQLSVAEAMTFEGLNLNGFPSVEFRPLYKVIYQYKDGFANSVKSSTIAVYDLRSISSAGVAAALVQDHGNLSGLTDDDHPQYVHTSEVRTPSAAVKNSFFPSQVGQTGKFLSTDGTNTVWEPPPSGSLSFTGDVTGSGSTGSSVAMTLAASGVVAGQYTKVTVDSKGRVTAGTGVTSADVTSALGYTPYNATNPAGYTTNVGTVTSVSGTGTVSGLTLTGSVTSSGSLTLGGTLTLTSGQVTSALGYTPANSTSLSSYLPLSGGTLTGQLTTSYSGARHSITDGTNGITLGLWDGSNIRFEGTGRPMYFVSYGGTVSIGRSSGSNLVVDTSTVSYGGNALLHAGNYSSYSLPLSGGTLSGTLYFTDSTNGISKAGGRLTIRSESTDDVANFASYGLYLPRGGQTAGLYVQSPIEARGGLRMGDAAGNGTITVGADTAATANRLVQRDSGGDIYGRYFFGVHFNQSSSNTENPSIAAFWTNSGSDNYNRKSSPAHVISQLGLITTGNYSSYALPLTGGSVTGRLFVSVNGRTNYYTGSNIEVLTSDNTPPSISFHRGGYSATSLYENDGELYTNAWTSRAQNGKLLSSGNYSSYALPLSGGTLTGTILVGTSGSGSGSRALRVAPSGSSPASFGSYSGSWRSTVEIWDNAATRMLFLAPPDGTNFNYSYIKSTDAGLLVDVGSGGGTRALNIEASGVVNAPQGLQSGGSTVLHAGNYTSYSPSLSGNYKNISVGGLYSRYNYNDSTWINDATSAYTLSPDFGQTTVSMHNSHGLFGDWATTLTMSGYERYGAYQISGQYNATTPALAMRNYNQSTAGWTSWTRILSSANYNNYSPTLTGGGASGTWGINITGSANTVTNLNSVIQILSGSGGATFGSNHYSIGKDIANGSWSHPHYSDLIIGYHTGIRIGAAYSGIRFYNNSPTTDANNDGNGDQGEALLMTIGGYATGGSVNIVNDCYAYAYRGHSNVAGTGQASYHPAGIYSVSTNWLYGTIYMNGNTIQDCGRMNGPWTSSARCYSNEWIEMPNYSGLYSPLNGAHFYPNNASYGPWRIAGSRNGWNGIEFDASNGQVCLMIQPNSNTSGVHNNSYGWHWQWSGGTMYCFKNSYGGGTQATVLDSSNYTSYSPSLTGSGASGSWSITAARATRANGNFYIDDNYGNGVVGVYASTRYQGVFAMGDSYKLPADGTSAGNLYGIAWSYPSAGGVAGNLDSHGMLVLINGGFGSCMSYSIKASGNVTAYSDERLKTNWRPMPESFVERLAAVKVGIYDRTDGERITQVGVSAQSLQRLLPEAITKAGDEMGTLSVSYGNAAMASAVELAKELVQLKRELAELKSKLH